MATQEEKELRKKVLEDIRRKRAAAAQAEGVVGAAEEGQYGDVGQGEKGPFDDIIDQTSEMVTTPQTGIGALMTLLGQGNIFLADKRVPFSNLFTEGGMDFTDVMKLISKGPDDRVYTEKDLGKKIGYGNVVTEEMLGQKKPLTLADISQNIGKFLFEGSAKQMERARDEGVGYFDMTPMERFEVASGPLTEIIPGVGFAPDIIKGGIQIARPAGQSILKSIDELTAPLNEIEGVTDTGVSLRVGETTEKSKVGGEVAGITNKPPRQIKVPADSDPDLSKLIVKGDDGKDYVLIGSNTNNRLVELDKVKLVKKRLNESDRNPRDQYYFDLKSKDDDKRLTVDEPGSFVTVGKRKLPIEDTTRIDLDEPAKNRSTFYRVINEDAKLRKEKNDAYGKFARYFKDNLTDKKNIVEIAQDSEFRFFNNIRRTEPDLFNNPSAFFEQYNPERIQPGGDLYEKYLRFEQIDKVRKTDIENLKPILQKILGKDARVHFEVAHKYMASGIQGGFVSQAKKGTGADASELYIDIAQYNSVLQGNLEAEARKIITEGLADGKTLDEIRNMRDFKLLDLDMKNLGVQGEAYGLKIGEAKSIDDKIGDLIIRGLNTGRISDAESKIAEEAVDRILDAKREYTEMFKEPALMAKGGLATMEYMTRPLNAQR